MTLTEAFAATHIERYIPDFMTAWPVDADHVISRLTVQLDEPIRRDAHSFRLLLKRRLDEVWCARH